MAGSWTFGRYGEDYVFAWLKAQGYYILPASLIENGGAPLLEGQVRKYVSPDILAAKGGASMWIDVKTKARMTLNQLRHRWETGFSLRHWENYLAVQRHSGIPGAVAFLQIEERCILLGKLDDIAAGKVVFDGPFRPGHRFQEAMIFFGVHQFARYEIDQNELFRRVENAKEEPTVVRPWEGRGGKAKHYVACSCPDGICWPCCNRPCESCGRPTGSAFIRTCTACVAKEEGP